MNQTPTNLKRSIIDRMMENPNIHQGQPRQMVVRLIQEAIERKANDAKTFGPGAFVDRDPSERLILANEMLGFYNAFEDGVFDEEE